MSACKGDIYRCAVHDPLGRSIWASYGFIRRESGHSAIIEIAEASGICLISESDRNVLSASSYGTGELVCDALNHGCQDFLVCIGGSATNDGGAGMAQALGFGLLDANGDDIPLGGAGLSRLYHIETRNADTRLKSCDFTVLSDVTNPLCGPNGASAVFGPQKGASPNDISILDKNLFEYAHVLKREFGMDVLNVPGAGAAGGLGAGLIAFLGARLVSGVEAVMQTVRLKEKMKGVDFVITGEGRYDSQSVNGKVPVGVALAAKEEGISTVLIAGSIVDEDIENKNKHFATGQSHTNNTPDLSGALFTHKYSLVSEKHSVEFAIGHAAELIEATAAEFAQGISAQISL
jgi:glycerate kinase